MHAKTIRNAPNTVKKALDILEAFVAADGALGVTELSQRVQANKSTVYRILQVLLERGYVDQGKDNTKYSLGYKVLSIGGAILSRLPLREVGRPTLEALAAETSQTVRLATRDRDEVVYIEHVEGRDTIRLHLQVGSRGPIYCTAAGKAMLAFLPERETGEILDRCEFRILTQKTIPGPEALRGSLDLVRKQGYSICDEEYTIGVRAVGAPIFDLHARVAGAIVIVAPSFRLKLKEMPALGQRVKTAAAEISRKLGSPQERDGKNGTGRRKVGRRDREFA